MNRLDQKNIDGQVEGRGSTDQPGESNDSQGPGTGSNVGGPTIYWSRNATYQYVASLLSTLKRGSARIPVPKENFILETARILLTAAGDQLVISTTFRGAGMYPPVRDGQLIQPNNVKMMKLSGQNPMRNVSKLMMNHPGKYVQYAGYAQFENSGIWHSHVWLVDQKGQLIETGQRQDLYYGCEATDARNREVFALIEANRP